MSEQPSTLYRFGSWLVEPHLNRVRCGTIERHLEPKSIAVLCCLLERHGEVVSASKIFDEVWPHQVVGPNALHRHIARIRQALEDDPHTSTYIQTISKQGYRAIAPVSLVSGEEAGTVPYALPAARGLSRFRLRTSAKIGIIAVLLVAAWCVDQLFSEQDNNVSGQSIALRNSVAVLPFRNLSPNPEDAYFAAGIYEETLNQLARIEDLKVIARASVLPFADGETTIADIAEGLGVETVMQSSVRYDGTRVRITAQLIDGATGRSLWSEAFEQDLSDIFGIQLAIASEIARALEANISQKEQTLFSTRPTDDPVAYAHYLRAVSQWGNYAPTAPMHEAIDAAIAQDRKFAAALAFKAFLHAIEVLVGPPFITPEFGTARKRQLLSSAEYFANEALGIDRNQGRAHWVLGWSQMHRRAWESSQRHFEQALELSPNDYIVLNGAAWASLVQGDIELAVQLMERSVALNPSDLANQDNFASLLLWSQRWEDAIRQSDLIGTLYPDDASPYIRRASIRSYVGDSEEVLVNAAMAEVRLESPSIWLANAYSRVGDHASARRVLENVDSGSLDSYSSFWLHVALREYEVALDHLERAIDEGFPIVAPRDVHFLSHHPAFDPVRNHPRFRALVSDTRRPLAGIQ